MKNIPAVSVMMAEYNTDLNYLKESIESILNQTFNNFEFIIIDDCGRNDLRALAKEYGDDRLRIIKNSENKGLVYSLNKAIKEARADYLVRMDTDDIAELDRIEKLYDFITKNPEHAVVGSRAMEFSEDGDIGVISRPGEKNKLSLVRGDGPVHPTVIMKKEAVQSVDGYPDFRRAEDFALWAELLIHGYRIYITPDVLLRYRVNLADYSKRTLRYRMGELKAKMHYFPKLGATLVDYRQVLKSVVAGIAPRRLVYAYKRLLLLQREEDKNDDHSSS